MRQLRYSGMMETARIRYAGYPIRYSYKDFVERYRLLLPMLRPSSTIDCRQVTEQICKQLLPATADYQFGRQKVFLKDVDDTFLEKERARIVLQSIIAIQRGFRKVLFRRQLRRYREAALTIQKVWRRFKYRRDFLIARQGFHRLGACIAQKQLTHQFTRLRSRVIHLQAYCRAYLARQAFKLRRQRHKELEALRVSEELLIRQAREHQLAERKRQSRFNANAVVTAAKASLHSTLTATQTLVNGPLSMNGMNSVNGVAVVEQPQIKEEPNDNYIDLESSKQIVDDVFGFLDDADVSAPVVSNVKEKSLMFERELRMKKNIPLKLLSRPVKYYEAPPVRKLSNQTRL